MIDTILAIMAAAFGTGWGIQFLYYRIERRRRSAETKGVELDIDAKEDALRDEKLKQAYERITQLQEIINRERDRWVALAEETSALRIELLQEKELRLLAERDKCTVDGCTTRKPPRNTIGV